MGTKWEAKEGRQCTYNVTMRCVLNHCCSGKAKCITYSETLFVSLRNPASDAHAPYCHLRPAWLYSIIIHYLKSQRHDFRKGLINIKCVIRFPLKILSETFFIPRTERGIIKHMYWYDQIHVLV